MQISLLFVAICVHAQSLSLVQTLYNPMDCVVHPGSLSMGFSRLEYWSASPGGDLPDLGIKPRSPTFQADSLPTEPLGENYFNDICLRFFICEMGIKILSE